MGTRAQWLSIVPGSYRGDGVCLCSPNNKQGPYNVKIRALLFFSFAKARSVNSAENYF